MPAASLKLPAFLLYLFSKIVFYLAKNTYFQVKLNVNPFL